MSGDPGGVEQKRSDRYKRNAVLAGKEINLARERAGITQGDLAKKCGMSGSDISRFERGMILEMSVGRFFDMCEALSLDPVYVWTGKTRGRAHHSERPPAGDEQVPPSESTVRPGKKR